MGEAFRYEAFIGEKRLFHVNCNNVNKQITNKVALEVRDNKVNKETVQIQSQEMFFESSISISSSYLFDGKTAR